MTVKTNFKHNYVLLNQEKMKEIFMMATTPNINKTIKMFFNLGYYLLKRN